MGSDFLGAESSPDFILLSVGSEGASELEGSLSFFSEVPESVALVAGFSGDWESLELSEFEGLFSGCAFFVSD